MHALFLKNQCTTAYGVFFNMIKKGKGYMYSKMSDSDYDELKLERQYVSHRNDSNYSR